MNSQTSKTMKSLLEMDQSISPEERKSILKACRTGGKLESKSTKLLTTKNIAEMLTVSTRTVYRYVERGFLHPVKFGPRTVRFRLDEVLLLIESGEASSSATLSAWAKR